MLDRSNIGMGGTMKEIITERVRAELRAFAVTLLDESCADPSPEIRAAADHIVVRVERALGGGETRGDVFVAVRDAILSRKPAN
jgi:hypothetical protein